MIFEDTHSTGSGIRKSLLEPTKEERFVLIDSPTIIIVIIDVVWCGAVQCHLDQHGCRLGDTFNETRGRNREGGEVRARPEEIYLYYYHPPLRLSLTR